jgi:WD40 repeat protein
MKVAWAPSGDVLAVSAGESILLMASPDLALQDQILLNSWAQDLTFDPTGNSLAAVDREGVVRVWDAGSKDLLQSLQAHQKIASAVAFNPEGSLIATAGYDAMARVWDLSSGEKVGEMIGGTFAIPAIAFSPDGASLAIVNGNVIRLRDVQSQRFVRTISGENPFFTIAFSPDGLTLTSGDVAGAAHLWDLSDPANPAAEIRQSKLKLAAPDAPVTGTRALVWQVAYNPDGTLLAVAGGDGKVRIWDVGSGALVTTLAAHRNAATTVAFSPDGRWLPSGGLDARVILWQVLP